MSDPDAGVIVLEPPARTRDPGPPARPARRRGVVRTALGFVAGVLPTLVVLAGAGAVGWWGHHAGWKLPKFSELTGRVTPPDDWCQDHNVPESACVECDPSLLPRAEPRGWCKRHGVPECTLCDPTLAQLPGTPTVTAADLDRAGRSLAFADRPGNNPVCRSHHRRIQYATARDADKAGVKVEPVWTAPAVEFVSAPGEIGPDPTRVARLSSRAPGTVWKVFRHQGEGVSAGDVLALVDAAEVGRLKAELLQAVAAHQVRVQTAASLKESAGAVPAARVREAEAAVREADIRIAAGCQALANLGLPLDDAEARTLAPDRLKAKLHLLGVPAGASFAEGFVGPDQTTSKLRLAAAPAAAAGVTDPKSAPSTLLPLIAPIDGQVVSRGVVAGEVVDAARTLFEVVDTRRLWLTLDLKGEDARRVAVDDPVRFKPDDGRPEVSGRVAWRSPQADPRTRTVKVRADLADPDRKLVANTFGAGRVVLREEPDAVSVPNGAVHWEGCCHVVFVRGRDYLKPDAPKVFHVRKVRLGAKDAKNTEVIAGVLPGELVVTGGSGLMLTELLRADLGDGCACCHPK